MSVLIAMVRPMDGHDPALMRVGGKIALAETMAGLRERKHYSEILFSVSASVPEKYVAELRSTGFPVEVSDTEAPQRRLLECMKSRETDTACVLTAYSVLVNAKAIDQSLRMVVDGKADAVYAEDVIASKFFISLNRKAAEVLSDSLPRPAPPFSFPVKLAAFAEKGLVDTPVSLSGLEDPAERFLWELLYAGERCAVPSDVLEQFWSAFPGEQRFDGDSFRRFIGGYYGIRDIAALSGLLERTAPIESSLRLAMHINYARALAPHFPENRGTALEIGHGKTGLTAQLVGTAFRRVIGVDPKKHSEVYIREAAAFIEELAAKAPGVLPFDGLPDGDCRFFQSSAGGSRAGIRQRGFLLFPYGNGARGRRARLVRGTFPRHGSGRRHGP